jgi:hypothetical protein
LGFTERIVGRWQSISLAPGCFMFHSTFRVGETWGSY